MNWTVCEVAAFEVGNFIAQEKLKIFEDDGSMSFTAKRLNSITDFNAETVIQINL